MHFRAFTCPTMPAIRGTDSVDKSKNHSVIDLTIDEPTAGPAPRHRAPIDGVIDFTDDEDDLPTIAVRRKQDSYPWCLLTPPA